MRSAFVLPFEACVWRLLTSTMLPNKPLRWKEKGHQSLCATSSVLLFPFSSVLLDILVLQLSLDESTQRSWSCKEIPIPASGKARRQRRPSVLLGEQNIIFALPHDHRVYVLERGRIVWEGGPSRFAIEAGAQYL